MNKATKIAILVVIVGATIAGLAFYATKSKKAPIQEAPKTASAPSTVNTKPQAQPQDTESLPPLPSDDKQAINSEIKGINDSLKSVDDTISNDTQDGALGL